MMPYKHYLKTGNPPSSRDKGWLSTAACYVLIEKELYKRGHKHAKLLSTIKA